jgi:hypothetical protein
MQLQNKAKYNLAKIFAKLIPDPADATVICAETIDDTDPANPIPFNYSNVIFAGTTAMQLWTNIITATEEQSLLLQMVLAVKNKNNGNADLSSMFEEIKDGFVKRVDTIARSINKNECVLFLGPEMLQCIDSKNKLVAFNRFFSMELSRRLDNAGVYYDKDLSDTISYISNRFEEMPNVANRELGMEVVKSFKNAQIYKPVFDKIAQLKFPLIINTNPDDLLEQVYKKTNTPYVSDFYDRSNQNITENTIDDSKCIIYNIFGSFKNPYSILLTDNDRVQFSKNVVKNEPKLPPVIKMLLDNKCCLFLGFNFQEWHLKILIDCLGLTKKEDQTFALLMDNENESSVEHFEKNYKFYFIDEDINKFLDEVILAKQKLP